MATKEQSKRPPRAAKHVFRYIVYNSGIVLAIDLNDSDGQWFEVDERTRRRAIRKAELHEARAWTELMKKTTVIKNAKIKTHVARGNESADH